jgi:hypothetical protein
MTQRDQLTNDQSLINDAVDSAAIPISIEIDRMLSGLPADADLDEIASALIVNLAAMSDHPNFIVIFTEALAARRALTELGIKI